MSTETLHPDDPKAEFFETLRKQNEEITRRARAGENELPAKLPEQPEAT
jgi:hypothetical protein